MLECNECIFRCIWLCRLHFWTGVLIYIYNECCFGVLEGISFSIPYLLNLNFETSCVVCSQNLDAIYVCFKFFSCRLLLMIFFVSGMFLVLSLFLSWSRFFHISVNCSGLFLLYAKTYAKGSSLLCFFGVHCSFDSIFLLIRILYF